MRLKLQDDGYPFMKIMNGRQWIGRTYKDANGRYVCVIGTEMVYANAASHVEAFREGGARYMGHVSAAALKRTNEAIRQRNAEARRQMNDMVRAFESATPAERVAAFDAIMQRVLK